MSFWTLRALIINSREDTAFAAGVILAILAPVLMAIGSSIYCVGKRRSPRNSHYSALSCSSNLRNAQPTQNTASTAKAAKHSHVDR